MTYNHDEFLTRNDLDAVFITRSRLDWCNRPIVQPFDTFGFMEKQIHEIAHRHQFHRDMAILNHGLALAFIFVLASDKALRVPHGYEL